MIKLPAKAAAVAALSSGGATTQLVSEKIMILKGYHAGHISRQVGSAHRVRTLALDPDKLEAGVAEKVRVKYEREKA